jgi:tetratricopeptide (TPR) repeat protein
VLAEPSLAGVAIVGHRALREIAALMGADPDTSRCSDRDQHEQRGEVPHDLRDHITLVTWPGWIDPLYTTVMKSLLCVLALVACGGPQKDTTPNGGGSGSGVGATKPNAAGDVTLEIPAIPIQGMIFEPEALGRPGMPMVASKNPKDTIDTVKKQIANQKDPVLKQAFAAVLATMLFNRSKNETGPAQKATVTEARQALRDAAEYAKQKKVAPDLVTLRMLGSYEIQLEEWAEAEKAWSELVAAAPKDANLPEHRTWWVYSLLKQYKNAEAIAIVKTETPSEKQPLLAYVTAWAKWRAGDDTGAWQAIVAAAAGWGSNALKDALDRDVLLFAGRSKVPYAQVKPELFKIFNAKQPAQQYEVLAKLGLQAYQFAGRWTEGVEALEEALKLAGSTVPPNDRIAIHYYQADFIVRLDQPEAASRQAKDAIAALPGCPEPKPCAAKEKQDIVTGIYGIARMFHLLYATANDIRYYQPAHDLYDATIPLLQNTATRTEAQKDRDSLEKTLKNTKAGTGIHEKQAIGVLLQRHSQEVKACYEVVLAANPKLGGKITLDLESDQSGAIKGAASEPKAGAADLSAVAGCAVNAAKQWKLPKRGMPGNSRIKLVYTLSRQ